VSVTSFHCELAWLGGETPARDVLVEVDDGLIVTVTPNAPVPPGATRLGGIVLPGLANTHSHAFHRALRSRTQTGTGTFWTWRDDMYRLAATLDPESYHRLARATFAEMALAGVTCVGEFHYLHHAPGGTPYADPNELGAVMISAAAEAGLRITLLDTCYLGAGIDSSGVLRPVEGTQLRFSDGTADEWVSRVEAFCVGALAEVASNVRVGAAIHSVRAVAPDSMSVVAQWAEQHDRVLHAHVSEQPAENEQCHHAYSRSPLGLLADVGVLGERFTAVHATHVTEHDVSLLATSASCVCMCPTTERDLADGIGPTARFRESGVTMCLGSDSHAVIDLFEEARAVELDERLASGVRGTHRVTDLLAASTAEGHRALGWPEAGRIEPGAPADLVAVDLRSPRTAGVATDDALAAVVYAASAGDVTDVVVNGGHVVRDGRHCSIDVAGELDASIRAVWDAAS
jgi:formiminoglutamate deiminase